MPEVAVSQPLLEEGELINSGSDDLESLRDRISQLEQELRQSRADSSKFRMNSETSTSAIVELRRQLGPLHRALRAVFGEIELATGRAGEEPFSPSAAPTSRVFNNSEVWDHWKQTMPGLPAKFIDSLLKHGPQTATALSISAPCHRANVAGVIHKLNKAGLIRKDGDVFSLKEIR
jgi:hypothetical protein